MRKILQNLIYNSLSSNYPFLSLEDIQLFTNSEASFGDISSNVAFILASKMQQSSTYVADICKLQISNNPKLMKYLSEVYVGGQGYINLILKDKPIIAALSSLKNKNCAKNLVIMSTISDNILSAEKQNLLNSLQYISCKEKNICESPISSEIRQEAVFIIETLRSLQKLDTSIEIPTISSPSIKLAPVVLQRIDGSYTKYTILLSQILSNSEPTDYIISDNSNIEQLEYIVKTIPILANGKILGDIEVIKTTTLVNLLDKAMKTLNLRIKKEYLVSKPIYADRLDTYEKRIALCLLDFFGKNFSGNFGKRVANLQETVEVISNLIKIKLSQSSDINPILFKALATLSLIH